MGVSANRQVVERFYAAVQGKDPDELEAVIADGFAPDAVMRLPASLPYGGSHEGRDTVAGLLLALVRTRTPMVQPDQIHVERMLEDGDQLAAEVTFPWKAPRAAEPIPMSAVEWFQFRDGRIAEMKVSYWDTAACVAALGRPPVS